MVERQVAALLLIVVFSFVHLGFYSLRVGRVIATVRNGRPLL